MKKLLLTAASIVAFSASAHAAGNTASADATATATVVTPIKVAVVENLDFGSFATGTAAGTVSTDKAPTSGIAMVPGSSATQALVITVSGQANMGYDLFANTTLVTSGSAPTATLTGPSGSSPMTATMTSFTPAYAPLSGGVDTYTAQAELAVAEDQAPGAYSGTINLVATYQ